MTLYAVDSKNLKKAPVLDQVLPLLHGLGSIVVVQPPGSTPSKSKSPQLHRVPLLNPKPYTLNPTILNPKPLNPRP